MIEPTYHTPDGLDLYHGDCRSTLAKLPAVRLEVN